MRDAAHAPGWAARLALGYALEAGRTVARFSHEGPLRVLKSLYPEGGGICHTVLVHPPGGLVGGDQIEIALDLAAGTHALVTTPAAGRFYRSAGGVASQRVSIKQAADSRLEWLPMETLYHSGCRAESSLYVDLAPGAELMAWDVLALGLPASGQPFGHGSVLSHWELPGHWLERGRIAADDAFLMDGPLGLAGRRCLGLALFAAGQALPNRRRDAALEGARRAIEGLEAAGCRAQDLPFVAGATSPNPRVVLVRALGAGTSEVATLLRAVRDGWRNQLWEIPAMPLRGWVA